MSQDVVRCYNRGTIWWGSRAKYIGTPDRSQKSLGIQSIFRMYDELLGGFKHCLFTIIYGIIIPTQLTNSYFSEGVETINHRIGWRENLQETPIFDGKKTWFPVDFPLNQSIEPTRILMMNV